MLFLLDANILVFGADPASANYAVCMKALETIRRNGDTPCIVPQSLYEFWSVATRLRNPIDTRRGLGLKPEEAYAEILKIKALFPLLEDNPQILPIWEQLVTQYKVSGVNSHDARYVAAMSVHSITHILTDNIGDFKRYPFITVVRPSEV
jgi:predicted nucleic acid-binding protein